jgi:AcrR family transcriptional regulator
MLEIATASAWRGAPAAAAVAARMSGWLLAARDPERALAAPLLAASVDARLGGLSVIPSPPRSRPGRTPRQRLHEAALRLLVAGGGEHPSGAEIADAAGVSVTCFLDLFRDGRACQRAALAAAAEQTLESAVCAQAQGGGWPLSVRQVLEALFVHLAARPLHVAALTGWPASDRGDPAMPLRRLALLVLAGAPAEARSAAVQDGIVGAVWHTIARQAGRGRLQLLPLLAADVAYVVLAPSLGARRAAEVAATDLTASGACG